MTRWNMVKLTLLSLPCVLKNASAFISSVPRLILCSKGLGHLLLLNTLYFTCFYFIVAYTEKSPKNLSFSACSYSLSKVTCQYLLLLVGFETLTYQKHYDRSPRLVGHQELFSGAIAGEYSTIGK